MTIQDHARHLNTTYQFNVIPMYHLIRETSGDKRVKMIEWQQYKAEPYPLDEWQPDYKALAIMTGQISNLTILDIDSEEALDTLLNSLGGELINLADYIVKTTNGYQLFYSYEPNTTTRIGIKDKIDFLSGGVTFATEPNPGYQTIKSHQPQPMPQALKDLILDDEAKATSEDTKAFEDALRENSTLPYRHPLQPLIKKFTEASRITMAKELEKVFCTKDYADYDLKDFAKPGQVHASMMYVLGIVAAAPTVSQELYLKFARQWAKKVAKIDTNDSREEQLITNRIKGGMKYFRYDKEWESKAEELTSVKAIAQKQDRIVWFDPEDDKYVIYHPEANRLTRLGKVSFKDSMARVHNKANPNDKMKAGDISVEQLNEKYTTFDPTVSDRFFKNMFDEDMFNDFIRTPAMHYFLTATPSTEIPPYFKHLLDNVIPVKEEQELWLHNLAYHLTYLQVPQTMTVITGAGGTGKGTLLNDVHELIYKEYHATVSAADMTKQFRSVLKNKLSVFVDEGDEKVGKFAPPKLTKTFKELVGNSKAMIESKNANTLHPDNHNCKYTLATNSEVPFKFENGDRRTNVFKTKDTNITTLAWFTNHDDLMARLTDELYTFMNYLKSIEVSAKRSRTLINNRPRQVILEASVNRVDAYVEAILTKDVEALIELDHDFGEWYERLFITDGKSSCPVKDLKAQLGDMYSPVAKALKNAGVNTKKSNNVRSIILNPKGSDKPFKN